MKTKIQPLVDIVDSEKSFYIYCDLPGVHDSKLDVDVEGHVLSISGKAELGESIKLKDNHETFYECRYELGETIDIDNIVAKLDQGVLKIDLPKIAKKSSSKIKIEVA